MSRLWNALLTLATICTYWCQSPKATKVDTESVKNTISILISDEKMRNVVSETSQDSSKFYSIPFPSSFMPNDE